MRSRFDLYDWTVRRGMLLIGVLLSVTIAAAVYLPMYIIYGAALLLLVLILLPWKRKIVPFFCLVVVLIGLWRGALYRVYTMEAQQQYAGCQDTIEGIVEECPRNGHMYTVRITDAESIPVDSRVLLYCSDRVAPSLYDTVTASVEFKALYSSQQYRYADGVFLQAFPTTFNDDCVVSRSGTEATLLTALRPFRSMMSDSIYGLLGRDEGGLLAAVCLRDTSAVSEHIADAFRSSGLSHLLSVSGLHMSVIAGGMLLLMRALRVKRLYGNLITSVVILLFMWLVEFTPSATRAGVMYLILIIGQTTRYQSDSLNSLGLALSAILLVSPSSIFDVGLWLSFLATVGILCVTPRINRPLNKSIEHMPMILRVPLRWLFNSLSISIGCTLPILPLLLVTFGEVSVVSPISNLLAVLPAGWMTVLGCLGALLSIIPYIGFIGKEMLLLAGLLAKWLVCVSEWCSAIPGAVLRPTSLWMIILIAGAGVLLSIAAIRLSFRHTCCVLCALLTAFIVALPISSHLSAECTTVTFTGDDYGTVVVLQRGSKAVVLTNQAACLFTASRILGDLRVFEPQLIIADSCKTQHEAYLADWERDYPSMTVACVGDVSEGSLVDYSLAVGDRVSFWDDCSLSVLSDDWWLLSIGNTRMLVALSRHAVPTNALPTADAVLLYESALTDTYRVAADVLYCVSDDAGLSLSIVSGNVRFITAEETACLVTDGGGSFRQAWRPVYVLE